MIGKTVLSMFKSITKESNARILSDAAFKKESSRLLSPIQSYLHEHHNKLYYDELILIYSHFLSHSCHNLFAAVDSILFP